MPDIILALIQLKTISNATFTIRHSHNPLCGRRSIR